MHQQIIYAWQVASQDLMLQIEAPFTLQASDGTAWTFLALLKNFGHPHGMLLLCRDDTPLEDIARQYEYGYSCLGESYKAYDRELFIDTLNDWGWVGEAGHEPAWYSDRPWTE